MEKFLDKCLLSTNDWLSDTHFQPSAFREHCLVVSILFVALLEGETDVDASDKRRSLTRHSRSRRVKASVVLCRDIMFRRTCCVLCCAILSSYLVVQAPAGSLPMVPQPPSPAVFAGAAIDLTDDIAVPATVDSPTSLPAALAPHAQVSSVSIFLSHALTSRGMPYLRRACTSVCDSVTLFFRLTSVSEALFVMYCVG